MKKPVKKAVTRARKKTAMPARAANRSRRKAPVPRAKSAARPPKARPPAYFIPPILFETAPSPHIPSPAKTPETKPQVVQRVTGIQESVAETPITPPESPVCSLPIPPSTAVAVPELAPLIPTLVEPPVAPVWTAPEMPAMAPGAAAMEPHELELGVLRLLARDPHWLFATWDFPSDTLAGHRLHSADGSLRLKVHAVGYGEEPDIVLNVEAREWFIPVERAGTEYRVEMGYRNRGGAWVSLTDPAVALTPACAPAAPATARMRTVVFPDLEAPAPGVETFPAAPITVDADLPWVPEVQAALEALSAPAQKAWIPAAAHSLHLARPEGVFQSFEDLPPPGGAPSSLPGPFSLPTSPQPGQSGPLVQPTVPAGKFWFTVNAELIVYGATEPDARVEIGGHPIRLRADGGFSFRFALPEGRYQLPVAALSADGLEFRGAVLQFERCTQTSGTVGVHPQDPELKKPVPESCA